MRCVPFEFPCIAVCDGITMNHKGMNYSLPSREIIADSIEIMATAHPFDALVFITSCDKVAPDEIQIRIEKGVTAPQKELSGILERYASCVSNASEGAYLRISKGGAS